MVIVLLLCIFVVLVFVFCLSSSHNLRVLFHMLLFRMSCILLLAFLVLVLVLDEQSAFLVLLLRFLRDSLLCLLFHVLHMPLFLSLLMLPILAQ